MTVRLTALLCIIATAIAGCGIDDPYNDPPERDTAKRKIRSATPGPSPESPEIPADERAALEEFARWWSNWSSETLPQTRAQLAERAAGDLRESLLADARRAADDAALRSASARSRGTVEAVVLRPDQLALIVVNERAELGTGDVQAGYTVYLGRAQQTPAGWKVVTWRPV